MIPEKHPPSPAVQKLHVLFINILLAVLDLGAESLQPLGDSPGHPERYFVRKHIQNCKDKEGERRKPPFPMHRVSNTSDQGSALTEGIFGVVGRLSLSRRSSENDPDGRYKGSTGHGREVKHAIENDGAESAG